MATKKGTKEELRNLRNNVVFVVADEKHRNDMKLAVTRRLALLELNRPDRIQDLADYQQRKVKEELEQANFRIAMAVIQCYRHLFYPSHVTVGSGDAQLGHTAIEIANASDSPGNGQLHIIRTLRDQKKLLAAGDIPDAPTFVRDQTPLKTKGRVTTLDLRNEFRRAPKLSILLDNGPLVACIRQGIETSVFIYQKGELLWGPGAPPGRWRFPKTLSFTPWPLPRNWASGRGSRKKSPSLLAGPAEARVAAAEAPAVVAVVVRVSALAAASPNLRPLH